MLVSKGNDARLAALWDEWQRTYDAHDEAEDMACQLDTQAKWPEQVQRWKAGTEEYDAWKAACDVERERSGVAVAEKRSSDLWIRVIEHTGSARIASRRCRAGGDFGKRFGTAGQSVGLADSSFRRTRPGQVGFQPNGHAPVGAMDNRPGYAMSGHSGLD